MFRIFENWYRWVRFYIRKIFCGKKSATKDYLRRYLYVTKMVQGMPQHQIPKCNLTVSPVNRVWTMWLQDERPDFIQMGLNSIFCFYPQAVIITEKNVSQYLDIPAHIMDKYRRGIIEPAHFSDYVRVALLDMYGGTWIDASCLMMDKIPNFIMKQTFFILQNPNKKDVSNFFIHAAPNNYFIRCIRVFLEEYWRHERRAIDYFFFHWFVTVLFTYHPWCHRIWFSQIPYLNSNVKYFSYFLGRAADMDAWRYLSRTCFIYKIHRRSEFAKKQPNSWYYFLLNMYRAHALPHPGGDASAAGAPVFQTVYETGAADITPPNGVPE